MERTLKIIFGLFLIGMIYGLNFPAALGDTFRVEAHDVVIVGGGLAGIVAAHALKDYNLDVLLLDENKAPGGSS